MNEDIDVDNADALLWAISYRSNPVKDIKTVGFRGQGHGPKREHSGEEDSSLLIDATMKSQMPPLALPAKQHMQRAMEIWQELGLPKLNVKSPSTTEPAPASLHTSLLPLTPQRSPGILCTDMD